MVAFTAMPARAGLVGEYVGCQHHHVCQHAWSQRAFLLFVKCRVGAFAGVVVDCGGERQALIRSAGQGTSMGDAVDAAHGIERR
jgi:hypothetical protein